jgi:RNA polymerase sigma factor (sigma-70 family)
MSPSNNNDQPESPRPARFASTRWSLVAAAGQSASPESQEALATLCRVYWYPLYAFARRRLGSVEDAQDVTQAFFAQLLEKDYLKAADPERGKFRAFLLTAFKHFLSKAREHDQAQKRGGGQRIVPLDFQSGERRYTLEPADHATPEAIFERRWALTLLEQALARLRQEFETAGKSALFESLKGCLTADGSPDSYAQIAERLDMTAQAVKVASHRLRRRYQELLRDEIGQTVSGAEEIDEELRNLFAAVRGKKV